MSKFRGNGGRGRLVMTAVASGLLAVMAISLPAAAGQPAPTTRFVDDDGTAGIGNCNGQLPAPKRIQGAINQSNNGDTILVCPGNYPGFRVDNEIDSPDRLTIRSVVPWAARVISGRGGDDTVIFINGIDDTTIQWLTVLAKTSKCGGEGVENLISLENSDGTRLRANHLGTLGDATLGPCGYENGISI